MQRPMQKNSQYCCYVVIIPRDVMWFYMQLASQESGTKKQHWHSKITLVFLVYRFGHITFERQAFWSLHHPIYKETQCCAVHACTWVTISWQRPPPPLCQINNEKWVWFWQKWKMIKVRKKSPPIEFWNCMVFSFSSIAFLSLSLSHPSSLSSNMCGPKRSVGPEPIARCLNEGKYSVQRLFTYSDQTLWDIWPSVFFSNSSSNLNKQE